MQPLLRRALAALALAPAFVAIARAQTPVWLVGAGDELEGIGTAWCIESVMVNFQGWWIVQVRTDNPAIPSVALHEGLVLTKVGDSVPAVPGATVAGLGGWTQDMIGGIANMVRLAGTPGGS